MSTINQIKNSNVFNSNSLIGDEQESQYSKYKSSILNMDDKNIDIMNMEDLRYLVKIQMKKIKVIINKSDSYKIVF